MLFDAINPSSNQPFAELFFSLFKSHIASKRHLWHLFSIKTKEIIKLKIKVSGRVRVGRGLYCPNKGAL